MSKSLTLDEVQNYLYENIPITKHLGTEVTFFNGKIIRLSAPLDKNINHRETAFGGSISALAILSGWILIHLRLVSREIRSQRVIQKSKMNYLSPVEQDFQAECIISDEANWEKFIKTLFRHKKSRITLSSTIYTEGRKVGDHEGVYVAVLR